MRLPPLVIYKDEADYRSHYLRVYCAGPIMTFDGIQVRFRRQQFDHCFFESSKRNGIKDLFSADRAQRIDWIRAVLESPEPELYEGWDHSRKRADRRRRVAIVQGEYVVIIALTDDCRADFVTAFVAEPSVPGQLSTIQKIRRGRKWQKENR
jgi:hypothetical protein